MRFLLVTALLLILCPASAIAAPRPEAVSATFDAFDKSIEDTKQAMMTDSEQALRSALAASALAKRLPRSRAAQIAVIKAEWLHGEALIFLNRLSDAQPIVAAALADAEKVTPDTKLNGDLLRSHGAIAASNGDILTALRDYQRAHEVFRKAGEARSRAIVLQDIGQIYWDAGDYSRSLDYYNQSDDAYDDDPMLTLTMNNSRGEVYRKMARYADANSAYEAALAQAYKLESPMLETRILTNLAGSQAEGGSYRTAQQSIDRAIALSRHGEAAGWKPFVFGVAARIAFDRGDLKNAKALIARTFQGVDLEKSEMLFREYHQTAAQIYEAEGDNSEALAHVKAFQRLDSEAQKLTASIASQLLGARFDFTNQNLKISNLKRGQLQRDIQIERERGTFQMALLGAMAIVLSVLAYGFVSVRRSRNKVRDANTELSQVNTALEGALKAKTEFLATTSHEIRTPLNGILGMTQVLLADRRIVTDIRERIEVVHGAGETMRALVDDILDVAKMESGKLVIENREIDLLPILRDVGHLWSGHAESKGLDLVIDIHDAPRRILSDGARIRQMVFNLMSNAVKFTTEGSLTLSASTEADADGTALVLSVSDTGVGIPADKLEAIFEAFQQVDGGVTRQFSGSGLGLAICRNIARAMNGEITVESVLGKGSTFTVRLPIQEMEADSDGADQQALAGYGLDDISVLIVEPDPEAAMMLRIILAAEAASTEVASTIDEALARLQSGWRGHVVVANVGSDEGNHNSTYDLRRLATATAEVQGIMSVLVGASCALTIADAIMVGADQVIAKPIKSDDLLKALGSLHGEEPQSIVLSNALAA